MASPPSSTYHKPRKQIFKKAGYPTGQDFRKTDIRGIRWKYASLEQAKFCQAYAGLPPARIFFLQLSLVILAVFGGLSAGLASLFTTSLLSVNNIADYTPVPGVVVFAFTLIGIAVLVRFGFTVLFTLDIFVLFGFIAFGLLTQNEGWINFVFNVGGTVITQLVTLQVGGIISTVDRSLPRSGQ